ncbi:MAG: YitT family protein [Oscillospiraceae bacterium]|nr:YitT family protein [Oscillospiraceae bacterium]
MKGFAREHGKLLLFTLIGNTMLAFAVCAFVVPQGYMLGGAGGIALGLQAVLPLRLSVLTAMINSALFLLGWGCLGWRFAARSLLSTVVYPVILAVFETLPVDTLFAGEDKLLCAVYTALLMGCGIGLVVREGGSTGGMDIPPCILLQKKGIPLGKSLLFFDGLILLLQILSKGMDGMLYSLLIVALTSAAVDYTAVSGEQKVEIFIISELYEQIRTEILNNQDAGVTLLDIETGYLGEKSKAILSVVYAKKYPELRDAVLKIDPRAFLVTSDVKNVNGVGYTLSRAEHAPKIGPKKA